MEHKNVVGKMNPEVKAAWLEALRSGEYKQGTGSLVDAQNNFCCLGVLCNLHAEAHPGQSGAYFEDNGYYMEQAGHLPKKVAKWAGIDLSKGVGIPVNLKKSFRATRTIDRERQSFSVEGQKEYGYNFAKGVGYAPWSLVNLNDGGANFKQIADVIEYSL